MLLSPPRRDAAGAVLDMRLISLFAQLSQRTVFINAMSSVRDLALRIGHLGERGRLTFLI